MPLACLEGVGSLELVYPRSTVWMVVSRFGVQGTTDWDKPVQTLRSPVKNQGVRSGLESLYSAAAMAYTHPGHPSTHAHPEQPFSLNCVARNRDVAQGCRLPHFPC